MRVAYLTREGYTHPETGIWYPGGTTWLRADHPARALQQHAGIETIVTHVFGQNHRTGEIYPCVTDGQGGWQPHSAGWDVIVFIRWMQAAGSQGHGTGDDIATVTRKAQAHGQLIVQDLDDWIWGIPTSNAGYWTTHPKYNPNENRDHYKRGLAAADLITVSTPYLAERLKHLRRPTAVLPNMIDLPAYTAALEANRQRWDLPARTVGWTGSTIFRGGDLDTLNGTIAPFMRRHKLTFIHGGAAAGQPAVAGPLGLAERTGFWSPDDVPLEMRPVCPADRYPELLHGIDIFVAPLADRPFNLAKSACKIQEASAAGIPYVASAVGPYLDHNGGGATARRARDWTRHLERLTDPAERRQQATRQLGRVAKQDMTVRWPEWRDAYLAALKAQ